MEEKKKRKRKRKRKKEEDAPPPTIGVRVSDELVIADKVGDG